MLCTDCNLRDKEFMEVFIKDLRVEEIFCTVFIVNFPLHNPGSHLISTIELYVAYQICTFCCLLCCLTPEAQCGAQGLWLCKEQPPWPFLLSLALCVFLIAERLGCCSVGLRAESWHGLKIGIVT